VKCTRVADDCAIEREREREREIERERERRESAREFVRNGIGHCKSIIYSFNKDTRWVLVWTSRTSCTCTKPWYSVLSLARARSLSPPTHLLLEKGRHRRAKAAAIARSSVLFPERKHGKCPHRTSSSTRLSSQIKQFGKKGGQGLLKDFPPFPLLFPEREPLLSAQPSDVLAVFSGKYVTCEALCRRHTPPRTPPHVHYASSLSFVSPDPRTRLNVWLGCACVETHIQCACACVETHIHTPTTNAPKELQTESRKSNQTQDF
jgi:hypothetical protein